MRRATLLRNIARLISYAVAPVEEQTCFAPGDALTSFALGGLPFGFSICYDLRFPELYRKLVTEKNVDAFVISSAWPFPRVEHLRVLAQARAIENQAYVIASNRVGKDDDLWFCGSSVIIDPRGVVIAAASADREELIHADVSQELVQSVRSRVQSLAHRRQDLYVDWNCAAWSATVRTNFGQRRDFVFSRHLLCNSSIPDHTISKTARAAQA